MKLVKEIETKTYQTDESGEEHVLVEEVKQYHYDSKEETLEHAEVMKELGYEDTEQRKTNIGTITDPEIIWFGCYVKYHEEKVLSENNDFKRQAVTLMNRKIQEIKYMQKRYQVVTIDNKTGFLELRESEMNLSIARTLAQHYFSDGSDGAAIYDIIGGEWCAAYGDCHALPIPNLKDLIKNK